MVGIGMRLNVSGNGARGIVYGADKARGFGHVWNVRYDNGVVRFLDSQPGKRAGLGIGNFDHFTDFKFLLTSLGDHKMNLETARLLATEFPDGMQGDSQIELAFNFEITEEHVLGFVFFYNAKSYWATRNFLDSLAGNGPIFVRRDMDVELKTRAGG